jgi:hypothetical protein
MITTPTDTVTVPSRFSSPLIPRTSSRSSFLSARDIVDLSISIISSRRLSNTFTSAELAGVVMGVGLVVLAFEGTDTNRRAAVATDKSNFFMIEMELRFFATGEAE